MDNERTDRLEEGRAVYRQGFVPGKGEAFNNKVPGALLKTPSPAGALLKAPSSTGALLCDSIPPPAREEYFTASTTHFAFFAAHPPLLTPPVARLFDLRPIGPLNSLR